MGTVNVTTFTSDVETVTRTKLNGLAANLVTEFNGSIDNANVKAAAAINITKVAVTSQASGDVLYFNGTAWIRLAKGTAGQVLTMNGGATAPEWATP